MPPSNLPIYVTKQSTILYMCKERGCLNKNELADMLSCNQYNIDDFENEKQSILEKFSALHLNVHSIERHIGKFQVFLSLLKLEFNVLCFTESKIIIIIIIITIIIITSNLEVDPLSNTAARYCTVLASIMQKSKKIIVAFPRKCQ